MYKALSTSKIAIVIALSLSLTGFLEIPSENFLPTRTIGEAGETIYLESSTTYSSPGTLIVLANIVTATGTSGNPDGISVTFEAPLRVEIAGTIQTGRGLDGAADQSAGRGGDINIATTTLMLRDNARLETGAGGSGLDAASEVHGPTADIELVAQDGGHGGSIDLGAAEVLGSPNFRLGDGGRGGNATITVTDPTTAITATSTGGNGGSSGWVHSASYTILDLMDMTDGGRGGEGGHATTLFVKDQGDTSDQDAEGGGGLAPLEDCTPHGADGEDDSGSMEPAPAPNGYSSNAYGGNGCDGGGAQPNGGKGGNAFARAGDGGFGLDTGGHGGSANSYSGDGGYGATGEDGTDGSFGEEGCWPDTGSPGWNGTPGLKGGDGGNGGNAYAWGGDGGYGPLAGGSGGPAYSKAGRGGDGGGGGTGGDGHNGDPPGDAGDGGPGGLGGSSLTSYAEGGNGGPSNSDPGSRGRGTAETSGPGDGGSGGIPGLPGLNNHLTCNEQGDEGEPGIDGQPGSSRDPREQDGINGQQITIPQPPSDSDPAVEKRGIDDSLFSQSAGHGVPLRALACAAEDRGVNQSTFWSPTTDLDREWGGSPCIEWNGVRGTFALPGTYPYAINVTDNQSSTTTVWGNVTIDPITSVKSAYCTATCDYTSIIDDDGSITFTNSSTAPFDGVLTIHSSNTDSDDNVTQAVFDPGSLYDPLEISTHFNVSELPNPEGSLSILTLRGAGNNIHIGINGSSSQLIIWEGNRTVNTTHEVTEGQWEFLQASLTRGTLDVAVDGAVVGTFYTPLDYYVDNLTAGAGPRTNATLELAHLIASNGDIQNGYAIAEGFDESNLDPAWTTNGNVYLQDQGPSSFTPRETNAMVLKATSTSATAKRTLNISSSSVAAELKFLAPSDGVEWINFSLLRMEGVNGTVVDVGLFNDNLSLDVTDHHKTEWDVVKVEPDVYNTLLVRTLGDRYLVLLNDELVGSYHVDWGGPVNLTLGGESGHVGYDDIRIGNVQYLVRELFPDPGWREPEEWIEVNTYEGGSEEGSITTSGSARIKSPDASALEAGMVYVERTPAQPVAHFGMDFWFKRPTSGLDSPDYNRFELMTLESDTGDAFGIGFKTDSTDIFNLTDVGWASSATGSSVTTGEWNHYDIRADLTAGTVSVHMDGTLVSEGRITGSHLAKIAFGDRVNEIDLVNNRIGSGIGLWDDLTLLPLNHAPTISVDSPIEGANITSGNVVILEGTTWDPDVGDNTKTVEFRAGNGNWTQMSGTTFWSGSWDTTGLSNGQHTLSFRASDGRVAEELDITVNLV